MPEPQMKPIWYFVGLILLVMGTLILLSGIYHLISPPAVNNDARKRRLAAISSGHPAFITPPSQQRKYRTGTRLGT